MSTTHVDMEMMILQHLTAQSALLQQIAAGLVMLTQSLDRLQPMPHVKLGTDSKGMVKPEVNVYHPDATQAASTCEDLFDALDGKYNPSIERRDKAIVLPFTGDRDVDRVADALKEALA
jgi:hypothetical protein